MKLTYVQTILLIAILVFLVVDKLACSKAAIPKVDEKLHEDTRNQIRGMFDTVILKLEQRDSVKVIEYKNTIIKYEKIPDRINALNRDSLRRAVRNF